MGVTKREGDVISFILRWACYPVGYLLSVLCGTSWWAIVLIVFVAQWLTLVAVECGLQPRLQIIQDKVDAIRERVTRQKAETHS
jgi:hypothetical protein